MLVKVFIKRNVKKGNSIEIFKRLRKIRSEAMKQEGYVSGETMVDPDDHRKVLVISTWESAEDWNRWKFDTERVSFNDALQEFLEGPVEYETYVYSKYYLNVSSE